MKLHCGIGPNSYRVRIFLAEKGIDMPKADVDIMKGEQREAAFLKLNSLGRIPVLELDDGTAISESIAICRYFEALQPEPALFGADPVSQATVEMWNRRAEIELFGTVADVPLHTAPMFANRLTQFPAFAETQRQAAAGKWAWLDRELADGRPFLAGEAFSVADITAAVAAWLGEFFEAERPASLVHVNRWLERVQSRPSWQA
jgi:glutathione S-transferase